MTDDAASEIEFAKQRSPKYPYISLDMAVERARRLYDQVKDSAQPKDVMAKVYGKPATSSATIQTFATLSQYGLLEPVLSGGVRKLRVTALTRSIINPNAPDDVVSVAKKTAALSPNIFKELWKEYGTAEGMNDAAILYYLTDGRVQEHGAAFTDRAAQEVIRVYRATLAYAGLSESDNNSVDVVMEPEAETEDVSRHVGPAVERAERPLAAPQSRIVEMAQGERELQSGMLSKGASYRVIVSGQIGVKEIERLIKKLEMDKEILADEDNADEIDLLAD